MRFPSTLFSLAVAAVLIRADGLRGQPFRRGGTELNAVRKVVVPPDKPFTVVVVQFFHHGQIAPDGRNVVVAVRNKKPVPSRVLQLGPGDFCRVAFQTAAKESSYEILYGGGVPEKDAVPAWTGKDGLLLETRQYKDCNLNSLDSVRDAFNSSKRIGSDYVDNVAHAGNPFTLKVGPFLSRYSGYLRISSAGKYGFITSSQDCSFLLIDDKVVVASPGRHRPEYRAKPGSRKDLQLSAGPHKFEYYHAASGPEAMMVAAWEVSPSGPKPKNPVAIPTEAFGTGSIGHLPAGPVSTKTAKLLPDFLAGILGDVPLPDNDTPLIGVTFQNTSPPALTSKAKALWDFGDGQTGETLNPNHVYLRPGLYTVKLAVRRGAKTVEMANRVYVDRPTITHKDKPHTLDEYLPILETYDPRTLDAVSLRQLVLAYQWKSELVLTSKPEEEKEPKQGKRQKKQEETEQSPRPAETEEQIAARRDEARKYITAAVEAGQVAFIEESAAEGDEDLYKLAELISPMARNVLADSSLVLKIWLGAGRKITSGELKGRCAIEAADVAVNDLLMRARAKPLLDAATTRVGKGATGPAACRLQRVWGDYYAAAGDGAAARKAYNRADSLLGSTRAHTERTAWRGAHSRSTEQFFTSGELDRVAEQIRHWQEEFPADKIDGYLTLLYARYWEKLERYDQAIGQAEQLMAVNAASPYADRILLLAADCEVKRGKVDRALATLQSLLKDYPGSPLVPVVKKNIAALESGETEKPRKRSRSRNIGDNRR